MSKFAKKIKETLSNIISEMAASVEPFVKNPDKDFTRNRKLSFETMMHLFISMGGNTIYKELLEAHGYDAQTATTSAFFQQRAKILPFAFEFLLHKFTQTFQDIKTYRGYRLLAIDGSDLHTPTNPKDPDAFFQHNPDIKGYNLLHINSIYDLCNRLYVDTIIQPRRLQNEHSALVQMVQRTWIKEQAIVIADRNYESYNDFAHIEHKGWKYLIRVKDLGSTGILSGLKLPAGGEFDCSIHRIITRRHTKEVRENPDTYRFLSSTAVFDFYDENGFYPFSYRVVRIKINDSSYETLITNLEPDKFPPNELKKLYSARWGIESSFRELKYAVGLINLHSKKQDLIEQEIFARIIMHNFAEIIISHIIISQPVSRKGYQYQVNFTVAVHVCRHFLRLLHNEPPPDIEALIRKNILPIRLDRNVKRNVRSKTSVCFNYRVA